MTNPLSDLSFALGAATIAIFAYGRFNDPPKSRSTTTAFRFHTASAVYSLGMVAAYSVLAHFQSLGHTINVFRTLPQPLQENLTDPLVAALLITGLLPQAPGLSVADDWLRGRLKRMAAIPTEVRRLSAELRRLPIELPLELRSKVITQLRQNGIEPTEALLQAQEGPSHLWVAVSGLMVGLDGWRADPAFSVFLDRNWEEHSALKSRFDQLLPAARQLLAGSTDPGSDGGDGGRLGALAREYRLLVIEQIEDLHRRACELVSRGILDCRMTHSSRVQQIRQLGFRFDGRSGPVSVDQLVAIFLLVAGTYSIISTLTAVATDGDVGRALTLSLLIGFVYLGAVCCAVYPRSWWLRNRFSAPGVRPWSLYLFAGAMASAVAGSLVFVMQWLRQLDLAAAMSEMPQRLPWLLLAFGTAFMLSLQIDNVPSPEVRPVRWQTIEALVQSCASVLFAALVVSLFQAWGEHARAMRILGVSLGIGFMLGWFVPSWYRRDPIQGQRATRPSRAPVALSPQPPEGLA